MIHWVSILNVSIAAFNVTLVALNGRLLRKMTNAHRELRWWTAELERVTEESRREFPP